MKQIKKKNLSIILLLLLISFLVVLGIELFRMSLSKKLKEDREKAPAKVEEIKKIYPQKKSENKDTVVFKNPDIPVDTSSNVPDMVENKKQEENEKEHRPDSGLLSPVEKKDLSAIYIPLTKSVFGRTDTPENVFLAKSRLSQTQWDNMKTTDMKTLALLKDASLENLREGKLYYQGDNGRLESFLYMDSKRKISEYLISYDPKGNSVDCLEVGCWIPETDEKKFAHLSNNKLSVFELAAVKTNDKREEIVTEYTITPEMQFVRGKVFSKIF